MSEQNVEWVKGIYGAFSRGDIPTDEPAVHVWELAQQYGATIPTKSLLEAIDSLPPGRGHPAGTTDAFLNESRRESF